MNNPVTGSGAIINIIQNSNTSQQEVAMVPYHHGGMVRYGWYWWYHTKIRLAPARVVHMLVLLCLGINCDPVLE